MTWDDQLSAMTDQLIDDAPIENSLNATKTIADETDEYVEELNIDNNNIDTMNDRIIFQCLLGFTGHNLTNLTKGIVARYKAGRNVEHIVAYLRMLIGFIYREPHLFKMGLGTTGTIDVLTNDSDDNGDVLSVTGFSSSQELKQAIDFDFVTVDISSDSKSIIVGNIFQISTDVGELFSLDYTISDGNGGTDSATVTIRIQPYGIIVHNEAPSAVDDRATVELGTTGTINVLANDTDGNLDVVSITGFSATSSQGGTIARDGNSLRYTPADDFRGIDSFEYSISDGHGGTDSATVTITVQPNNEGKLIIGNDNLSTTTGQRETLEGDTGNDTIISNRGSDVLLGGAGADVFVYNSVADSGADPNAPNEPGDSIVDFNPTEDAIQLDFEIASGTLVSIDDVQIETKSINSGMATIKLSTHNSFEIILENLDPTTDPTTIESIIRNSIITPLLETI
ncbi:MAG: cadherin-like domain-containing protein [Hormoscilla sp. GUM202]|nr:cadherin-like domain-containing protein [Hormoscilla sp. GUM202]